MDQKRFLSLLSTLAKLCGFILTPELVALYDRALKPLGYDVVSEALEAHIIARRGQDRFPSVGDISRLVKPEESDEDQAIEVAGRIFEAIQKFGWPDPLGAEVFLGEIGWRVVQRTGGWSALCEGTLSRNVPSLRAQFREMALSLIRRARTGSGDLPPALPKPVEKNKLSGCQAELVRANFLPGGYDGRKT